MDRYDITHEMARHDYAGLGRSAYRAGLPAGPAANPEFTVPEDLHVGEGFAEAARAYIAGWESEHQRATDAELEQAQVTHFRVQATEMLFDQPETCPAMPGLTWDGVAADPAGDHYLIITLRQPTKPDVRAYFGPDPDTIARRALILIAGVRTHPDSPDTTDQAATLTWLATAWTALHEELAHPTRAITTTQHDDLSNDQTRVQTRLDRDPCWAVR